MGPAHYRDLRELYTKRMEVHGLGVALFHPIAAQDMRPPCCGYFDRNGDWNLICNLLPESQPPFHPQCDELGYDPLEYTPAQSMAINIEWQPKTAAGTQEHVVAGSAETPDDQPGGAEATVKYTSKSKFGAVLMTKKPITLTAYNDERLFRSWLEANRGELYKLHGSELKKYGMWLVTRTYTAAGASINAWSDSNKASEISTKAKAAMLGELGENLNWQDRLASRDWSHYLARTKEGLVVFMDGVDMSPMDWKLEGFKQNFPGATRRNVSDRSESRYRSEEIARRKSVGSRPSQPPPSFNHAVTAHSSPTISPISPATNQMTKPPTWALNEMASMKQLGQEVPGMVVPRTSKDKPKDNKPKEKSKSPARSRSLRRSPKRDFSQDADILRDTGLLQPLGLSATLTRGSNLAAAVESKPSSSRNSSLSSPHRSPSLRRETRSISSEAERR